MSRIIITIDGTAGVGKGTLSQRLAKHFSYRYLDTGAIYRVLGYKINQDKLDPIAQDTLTYAANMPLTFEHSNDDLIVLLDGKDITKNIRTIEAGQLASNIAKLPEIRKALINFQQDFAMPTNLVADGRDAGTNVFPQAQFKFYLQARPDVRALRRAGQLNITDQAEITKIQKSIEDRDEMDKKQISPADDAIIIDTSDLTAQEVFDLIISHIK